MPSAPRHVSVKEAVLPFDRFPRADALLGPGDAVDRRGDGRRARLPDRVRQGPGRRRRGAAARRARSSSRSPTATSRPRPSSPRRSTTSASGSSPPAAPRTAIRRMGMPVERIKKLGEGSPNVVDRIESGDVDLVINTPTGLGRARRRLRDPPRRRSRAASRASRRCRAPARPSARSAPSRSGETEVHLAAGAARRRARARRARGGARRRRPSRARSRRPGGAWRVVTGVERLGAYHVDLRARRRRPEGPAAGPVLHARRARRLGRGRRRAPVPAARVLVRARARADGVRSTSCSRRRPGTERLARAARRATAWRWWARSGSASRPPRDGRRPLLVGGGIGAAPLLCLAGRARAETPRVLLGFRRAGARRGGRAVRRGAQRRHRRRLGRAPGARHRPAARASSTPTRRRPSTPAARRRCSRPCARSAPSAACRPSSRWSPAWRAASAPASAASCPTTRRLRAPVRRRPGAGRGRARDRAVRGAGH